MLLAEIEQNSFLSGQNTAYGQNILFRLSLSVTSYGQRHLANTKNEN